MTVNCADCLVLSFYTLYGIHVDVYMHVCAVPCSEDNACEFAIHVFHFQSF